MAKYIYSETLIIVTKRPFGGVGIPLPGDWQRDAKRPDDQSCPDARLKDGGTHHKDS